MKHTKISYWNFLIFKDDTEENEEDYDIPDEIEEVIEYLLEGLRSVETVIRWSAAKGQLISKCPFGVFESSKNHNEIFSRISALASKKRSNQKNKGTLYH